MITPVSALSYKTNATFPIASMTNGKSKPNISKESAGSPRNVSIIQYAPIIVKLNTASLIIHSSQIFRSRSISALSTGYYPKKAINNTLASMDGVISSDSSATQA